MMRFLFAKRRDSNPPRPPQTSSPPNYDDQAGLKSHPRAYTKFDAEADEIEEAFADAVKRLPVKKTAGLADSSDQTVIAWRNNRNAPRFAHAMFLARRVSLIRNAVMEIIGGNSIQKNRLLNVLFTRLSEISVGPDEISAAKARAALKEFAEAATRPVDDGDPM